MLTGRPKRNLAGKRFGRLTAICDSGDRTSNGGEVIWRCRCSCGNVVFCIGSHLSAGCVRSCGCFQKQLVSEYAKRNVGKRNPNWRGGLIIENGRYLEYCPSHPYTRKNGRVYRARLVLEKKLGRILRKYEVAHHINGVIADDRPDNLMVMKRSEHNTFHNKKMWANKRRNKSANTDA